MTRVILSCWNSAQRETENIRRPKKSKFTVALRPQRPCGPLRTPRTSTSTSTQLLSSEKIIFWVETVNINKIWDQMTQIVSFLLKTNQTQGIRGHKKWLFSVQTVRYENSRVQELCESRGGRPGLPSLISLGFCGRKATLQPTMKRQNVKRSQFILITRDDPAVRVTRRWNPRRKVLLQPFLNALPKSFLIVVYARDIQTAARSDLILHVYNTVTQYSISASKKIRAPAFKKINK